MISWRPSRSERPASPGSRMSANWSGRSRPVRSTREAPGRNFLALAHSWRHVLTQEPLHARPILSKLLVGRVTFTPLAEPRRWELSGRGTLSGLFDAVLPLGMAPNRAQLEPPPWVVAGDGSATKGRISGWLEPWQPDSLPVRGRSASRSQVGTALSDEARTRPGLASQRDSIARPMGVTTHRRSPTWNLCTLEAAKSAT